MGYILLIVSSLLFSFFWYAARAVKSPDGYVTDQEPQEFTFEYQGSGTSVAEYAFTFEDEQTTVELSKADLTDKKNFREHP